MWLLAVKSLISDRGKFFTSLLGVVFSVVLINLQGSLLLGMIKKASLLVDFGGADIWVGHKYMNNVDIGTLIPERWIYRIRGVEGVERADPYLIVFSQANMRNGKFEHVIVVGCDSGSLLGNAWEMSNGDSRAIRHQEGVLVDVYDLPRLGNCKIGDYIEIGNHRAKIVGYTKGIIGFTTNPYVFTTLQRARYNYADWIPHDQCSYFLVKAKPGVNLDQLCKEIRSRVPELDVYDRRTYSMMCMEFWLTRTGIGISFGLAALLGLLVGLAVVAQTLYSSVTERIKEFGTLKAMGADDRCIGRFLLAQAIGTAVFGSALGLLVAYAITAGLNSPRAPIVWNNWVVLISVVLIFIICLVAAWLPYWRIRRIDPACVLRN